MSTTAQLNRCQYSLGAYCVPTCINGSGIMGAYYPNLLYSGISNDWFCRKFSWCCEKQHTTSFGLHLVAVTADLLTYKWPSITSCSHRIRGSKFCCYGNCYKATGVTCIHKLHLFLGQTSCFIIGSNHSLDCGLSTHDNLIPMQPFVTVLHQHQLHLFIEQSNAVECLLYQLIP